MSGECEKCGEHCLDCRCIDESISCDIQSKVTPIYEKYKDHPNELVDAFQFFIDAIDRDQYARFLFNHNQEKNDWILDFLPFTNGSRDNPELYEDEVKSGYICRKCAKAMNAVAPKDHICTWHNGICEFCNKYKHICHTSDYNWPDKNYLEKNREF